MAASEQAGNPWQVIASSSAAMQKPESSVFDSQAADESTFLAAAKRLQS